MDFKNTYFLLSRENITFFFAVVGFFGSVSGWIYFWITTRKNISMKISGYRANQNGLLTYFQITNNARIPIAINSISVQIDNKEYFCDEIPIKVLDTTRKIGKEVVSRKEYYSLELPINLSPLCGKAGYLHFPFSPEIQEQIPNELTFVIRTNRGRAMKKLLRLETLLP